MVKHMSEKALKILNRLYCKVKKVKLSGNRDRRHDNTDTVNNKTNSHLTETVAKLADVINKFHFFEF